MKNVRIYIKTYENMYGNMWEYVKKNSCIFIIWKNCRKIC